MLMTKAAYARHKSVSRQSVYDRIARGELVLVGGKIDASASEQKAMAFVAPAAWRDNNKRVNISRKPRYFLRTVIIQKKNINLSPPALTKLRQ